MDLRDETNIFFEGPKVGGQTDLRDGPTGGRKDLRDGPIGGRTDWGTDRGGTDRGGMERHGIDLSPISSMLKKRLGRD